MPTGMCDDSLQQRPTDASAQVRWRNVKTPDSSSARIVCVWVAIQPANADHLFVCDSEKQDFTEGIEPICPKRYPSLGWLI